jgi:ribosomal protein S18 acetylase RimI-like enzyme
VAYLISAMYPHDFESRRRREAWIEGLGTIQSHRGRGIASVMILEAFARFRDRDLQFAALGVDTESPTGAVGLYRKMGFEIEKRSVTYARWLD